MLDWLQTFGDFLTQICVFIIDFFKNVIEIITLVLKAVAYVNTIISYLPIQYQVPLIAIVSFSIIVTIVHFGE